MLEQTRWLSGRAQSKISFQVNGSSTDAMRLSSGGNLNVGGGNVDATDKLEVTGNLALITAGNKIKITTGTNASVGSSVLVAGTVTVSTTAVTASSKIFITRGITGGTVGELSIGTITAGTSFVINSVSSSETSTVNWWIVN